MSREKVLEKLTVDLLLERPFFGVLLSALEVRWSDRIPTAATDGNMIWINPAFWDMLSEHERLSLLAHEALHVGFLHHIRIRGRNPIVWNIAGDMAINPLLRDSGFFMPPQGVYDPQTPPRNAEAIYEEIIKNATICECSSPWGEVESPASGQINEEKEQERVRSILSRALAIDAGNIPGALERLVRKLIEPPPITWDSIMSDYIRQVASSDYSNRHFSHRHLQRGFYLPKLNTPELNIVVVLDTSGSIGDDDLSKFVAAMEDVRTRYRTTILPICCDTEVHVSEKILPEDALDFKCRGGGGTDFRPPFLWLEKQQDIEPDCLVYFTDGECNSYPDPQSFPVVWIIHSEKDWTVERDCFWEGDKR